VEVRSRESQAYSPMEFVERPEPRYNLRLGPQDRPWLTPRHDLWLTPLYAQGLTLEYALARSAGLTCPILPISTTPPALTFPS
jgi:hypothetical protein